MGAPRFPWLLLLGGGLAVSGAGYLLASAFVPPAQPVWSAGRAAMAAAALLVFVILVVTRQVRLMEARLRLAAAAERKFRGLVESAPDAVVIVDGQGRIVLVNAQTEAMFGYDRDELFDKRVEMLMPDRFRGRHAAHLTGYVGRPEARPMGQGLELFGRRRDGAEFPVEISLSPLETEEGVLVTSVIRDLTERKRAEADRLAAVERLKELERLREMDRFKTAFINTAAHELGTPLTPIRLQLDLFKTMRYGELDERGRKALDILDRNVERLVRLVEDVLQVARLQANRVGLERRPVDLNRLAHEAVESYQEPARKAGLTLELRMQPDLHVEGDEKRLTQVLFNLLSNAVKFTPVGGRVTVETAKEGDHALLRVRDTGIGLRREDLGRLFQPFTQVHDATRSTAPGTGLGLYISRGLVELHGGRLSAESPGPGAGATFTMVLPFEVPAQVPTTEVGAQAQPATPAEAPKDGIEKRVQEVV